MNSWLFLCLVLNYVDTIPIGLIRNVSLTPIASSFSNAMNGTSQQCLCAMMMSSNISAFNYFSNNTCQLFSSASLSNAYFSWTINNNSLFYFLQLPTTATATTQDTTTGVVSTKSSVFSTEHTLTTDDSSTGYVLTSTDLTTNTASAKTLTFSTMAAACTTAQAILPSTVAGTGVMGSSMKQLNSPNDIFLTTNGTLYVADYYNNRVQIFGSTNTTAIFSQIGMGRPLTVCVDNASNYYVTEIQSPNNRISKWPSNQTILTLFNAYGIAMDSDRNLYLSTLSNTIIFWNVTSNKNTTIASTTLGLGGPRHLYLDEDNQALYIADSLNNRIVKIRLGLGNLTVMAGGHGPGNAANQLNYPAGVCVSKRDGTIYVADANNNRIQKWMVNGTVGVTVLGNSNGTSGNGTHELNGPYSVALNADETFLYVADSNNNRIQRILLC